ncbi:TPA: replication protein [Escherichia coli]|nr:replication protein [Salmonella enterica]HBA9300466.1 replication protein [Escherichia coli]
MTDLQQTYYRQVKNPNPVFTPREGAWTLPFCEKLMGKAVGFTETFAFDIASARANGKRKRKTSVLRRRAIDALLQGMCFYYDPVSNQEHRSITELALDCGLARKNAHGHLAIERAVRAINSLEEDFGFIVCSPSSDFYNKRCTITLTPRFFEFLGIFPLALTEARLAVLRSGYGD